VLPAAHLAWSGMRRFVNNLSRVVCDGPASTLREGRDGLLGFGRPLGIRTVAGYEARASYVVAGCSSVVRYRAHAHVLGPADSCMLCGGCVRSGASSTPCATVHVESSLRSLWGGRGRVSGRQSERRRERRGRSQAWEPVGGGRGGRYTHRRAVGHSATTTTPGRSSRTNPNT